MANLLKINLKGIKFKKNLSFEIRSSETWVSLFKNYRGKKGKRPFCGTLHNINKNMKCNHKRLPKKKQFEHCYVKSTK